MLEVLSHYRFVVVIALLGIAAMLATSKGRLPLALRGLKKVIRQDAGKPASTPTETAASVPGWKRFVAFLLVILAFLIAVL